MIERLQKWYARFSEWRHKAVLLTDVSHWQGAVDWAVMARKVVGVYIRAGSIQTGDGAVYSDHRLEENAIGAGRVGLPFGFYWYFRPSSNLKKIHEQPDKFVQLIQQFGFSLPPMIDVEENGGLPKDQVAWGVREFILRVEEQLADDSIKYRVGIYTRIGFWNANVGWSTWMKRRLWWVARYKMSLSHPWSDNWKPGMPPPAYLDLLEVIALHQKSADHNGRGEEFGVDSDDIDINWYLVDGRPGTHREFMQQFHLLPRRV